MRPGLNKEIVRGRTAYRLGRVAVDLLLGLQWLGTVVLVVVFFASGRASLEAGVALASTFTVIASAVVGPLLALGLRELAHAVFDLADRALEGTPPSLD